MKKIDTKRTLAIIAAGMLLGTTAARGGLMVDVDPDTNLAAYQEKRQPFLVVPFDYGQRILTWAEIDNEFEMVEWERNADGQWTAALKAKTGKTHAFDATLHGSQLGQPGQWSSHLNFALPEEETLDILHGKSEVAVGQKAVHVLKPEDPVIQRVSLNDAPGRELIRINGDLEIVAREAIRVKK